jgi:hypothetical protein
MKKSILFTVVALAGITASAAPKEVKPVTKEDFLARKKAQAEAAGTAYDEAKAMVGFVKMDVNKDGVIDAADTAAKAATAQPASEAK